MFESIKNPRRLYVLALFCWALSALGACTQIIAPLDCASIDWRVEGYKDGKAGKSPDNLDTFRKACSAHKINPNQERYLAGYQDGQKVYCEPQNAYILGLQGAQHGHQCPESMRLAFLSAFEYGSKLKDSLKQLRHSRITIKKNARNLQSFKNSLDKIEKQILEVTNNSKDISRLSTDLSKLKEKLYTYAKTAGNLKSDTQKTQSELEKLQAVTPPDLSHS